LVTHAPVVHVMHVPAVRQTPAREGLPMHVLVVHVMHALVDD